MRLTSGVTVQTRRVLGCDVVEKSAVVHMLKFQVPVPARTQIGGNRNLEFGARPFQIPFQRAGEQRESESGIAETPGVSRASKTKLFEGGPNLQRA